MVKRVDGKGDIRWRDRPASFEELDDEVMSSGIEEAFSMPDEEIDQDIRDIGLGDLIDEGEGEG